MFSLLMNLAAAAPAVLAVPPPAPAGVTAIRAKHVHVGDGRTIEDGVVLIEDGVIRAVGRDVTVPDGVRVIEHDGHLSPGLVVVRDYSGAGNETADETRPVLAEAELAHSYKKDHSDYRRALAEGITTVVLHPRASRLVGGTAAAVKAADGRLIERRAGLSVSMCSESLSINAFPTSIQGALGELDRLFEEGEGAFGAAGKGDLPVVLEVRSRADVSRALAFAKRHGLKGSLSGATRFADHAEAIKASGLSVILRPFDVGASHRAMESATALSEQGVPMAFGLNAPQRHTASLRFGAAMCIRAGLAPSAALKALTSDAARIAGVDGRVGRIQRGLDADLVLWSGEPTELTSSVVAVYADGEQVVGGEE